MVLSQALDIALRQLGSLPGDGYSSLWSWFALVEWIAALCGNGSLSIDGCLSLADVGSLSYLGSLFLLVKGIALP